MNCRYGADIKEKAYAMYLTNNAAAYTAEQLGVPRRTVEGWYLRWDKEVTPESATLTEIRQKQQEQFINDAWENITLANKLINRNLNTAVNKEAEIEKVIDKILSMSDISEEDKRECVNKLKTMKMQDMGKISAILGTLYDKQALSKREPTQIVDNQVTVKFEDL